MGLGNCGENNTTLGGNGAGGSNLGADPISQCHFKITVVNPVFPKLDSPK